MEKNKLNKGVIVAVIVLIAVAIGFCAIYSKSNKGTVGSKAYNIEIVTADGESTVIDATTDQEYLQAAMDELVESGELTYDGLDQTAGFMIQEINGERAVYEEDNSYWAIYVNGEYGTLGINAQPVNDGDVYKFAHEKF